MLKDEQETEQDNKSVVLKLTHNRNEWPLDMFCSSCADLDICGGIASKIGGHCYRHCCGGKYECDTICRNNPNFTEQLSEIDGFDLDVPDISPISHPVFDGVAPLILHGRGREVCVRSEIVVVKLREVVDMTKGVLKYSTREDLVYGLKIDPSAKIIVTGIEKDKWVEPWWSLGSARRRTLLRRFAKLGVALVTPPNFSLFCDQPRTDNFHAMKRIALVQHEFLVAGIPCALHPHIITEMDSDRWISFVVPRVGIKTIAYEFTTGAGHKLVRQMHINHLVNLAKDTPRRLNLVVFGDKHVIKDLAPHYQNILYVDTNAFMKTIYRKKAERIDGQKLRWKSVTTPNDISLEKLLQHNVDEVTLGTQTLLTRAA